MNSPLMHEQVPISEVAINNNDDQKEPDNS